MKHYNDRIEYHWDGFYLIPWLKSLDELTLINIWLHLQIIHMFDKNNYKFNYSFENYTWEQMAHHYWRYKWKIKK